MADRLFAARRPTAQQSAVIARPGPVRGLLQRKCACGGSPGPAGACATCRRSAGLSINAPGDRFEQEAERVADAVVSGRPVAKAGAASQTPQLFRQETAQQPQPEGEKYKEAAKKAGEAFLETSLGKQLKEGAKELGEAFWATLPGKVITGAAAAGAVTTLVATNSELPAQIPEIPLDRLAPGLSMQITYEGPVLNPTKAMLSFTFKPGAGKKAEKKPAQTKTEKMRAETAKMAAEQAKFRESLKSTEERAEEDKQFWDAYWRMRGKDPLNPLRLPGLQPAPTALSLNPREARQEGAVQRQASGHEGGGMAPPIVHQVLQSPGRPLDPATRGQMEKRFGHDFSRVRVHAGDQAQASARAVQARAYTVGPNVVFGPGAYQPGSAAGQRLLAHELAHVVQQEGSHEPAMQRAPEEGTAPPQPAVCAGKSLDDHKRDVDIAATLAVVDPEAFVPDLYLSLKRARTCFPSFAEADFLALFSDTEIYSEDMRSAVAAGYPKTVQNDDRKLIWQESKKPFAGYTVSGADPSKRFTTPGRQKQLGYTPAEDHPSWSELAGDPSKAQKPFSEADILVFSGHQYAQYKVPGMWSDDSFKESYDIRSLRGPLDNVKLLISTSCATICREPAQIWRSLFPKGAFLGYKKSAPLSGGAMAQAFASRLPQDLLLESGASGVSQAVTAWKSAIRAQHAGDSIRQPGWMDIPANKVEYWDGAKFKTVAADSEDNSCREKGDYSADFPDPGAWRGASSP